MGKINYSELCCGQFIHDSNARNDKKIMAMRKICGAEGYGIYMMILEWLKGSDYYISKTDYDLMAFDFRTSVRKVKSIIEDFGLFELTEDGKYFYYKKFNAIYETISLIN